MTKDKHTCHKCGGTNKLTRNRYPNKTYVCSKCSSIPNYKHKTLGFKYDGTPEQREASRVSMERILANRT